MSGNLRYLAPLLAALLLFLLLLLVLDRPLVRERLPLSRAEAAADKDAVLAAVNAYNAILSDIYASGGAPSLLDELPATKTLRHELFRDIGFLRDADRLLVYDLAQTIPIDIKLVSARAAEAVVLEQWNYVYQRPDDRMPLTTIRGMAQGFRYGLRRVGGRWIIRTWEPVNVKEPEQGRFLY